MAGRSGDHPFRKRRRRRVSACIFLLGVTVINAFSSPILSPAVHRQERRFASLVLRANPASNEQHPSTTKASNTAYRISPEQLQQIKDSVDIVSVVESYGLPGFQRQGNHGAKACCPFHDDHNPSMSIDNSRKLYKCFACGAGGDVFKFVQDYSEKNGERLNFYQAVRKVAKEFGSRDLQLDFVASSKMSDAERKELNAKKQRLLLANAAAAAFYGTRLIEAPGAGAARAHLQSRGLTPTTIKAFAIGYAPDAYFGNFSKKWGQGSLVHQLRHLGFTPSEIVDAGLATRTKRKSIVQETDENTDDEKEDYSTLMDRFRHRLVVPIFDSKGDQVLGFGGRILPPESGPQVPKYINSPESLVFSKKNVLFGQHSARQAVLDRKEGSTNDQAASIVIVEGYMDAIALWEVGVHKVVASMGTALTTEQMTNAARTVGTGGGRIYLCLDSDEAGVNAVERLCTGSVLAKTAESHVVEILVATLPDGVKDPAEFVESTTTKNKSLIAQQFRSEVLETAKDWTVWYLDRLLSRYDSNATSGTTGSFSDICDRVSDFLSRFPNPAERTKRGHDVAGSLADIISADSGQVSNALRIQLETDLVNMVARKAGARETLERRIESVEGISSEAASHKMTEMRKGDGAADSSRLSGRAQRAAANKETSSKPSDITRKNGRKLPRKGPSGFDGRPTTYRRGERRRMRRAKLTQPPLTPHFAGFVFENKSDADWLDLPRDKWKRRKKHLTLGNPLNMEQMAEARAKRFGGDYVSGLVLDELVYFNSNHYHGHQFLTQDAMDAGYSNGEIVRQRSSSVVEHGVGSLIGQDSDALVCAAEEKLLRNLVKSSRARSAIVNSLATGDATGSQRTIEWSCPERAWLFDCLIHPPMTIPNDLLADGQLSRLRNYFADLPDSPAGAFCKGIATLNGSRESNITNASVESLEENKSITETSEQLEKSMEPAPSPPDTSGEPEQDTDITNIPSDPDDIESWAASYDPSMFDDQEVFGQPETTDNALASYVARPQVLKGSAVPKERSRGFLDLFFEEEGDIFAETYDGSVSRELRMELETQEALATLLRASALKQLAAVRTELLTAGHVLSGRLDDKGATPLNMSQPLLPSNDSNTSDASVELDSMPIDELKEYCNALTTRLREASEAAYQLDVSAKKIGSRLMDYSNADGVEGRLSVARQEELASMVDEHVNSLEADWQAPHINDNTERDHNNRDPISGWDDEYGLDRNESFEEDLASIDKDWGEWANDDFVWTPEDQLDAGKLSRRTNSGSSIEIDFHIPDDDHDDETLEDALTRIDTEWVGWNDEDVDPRSSDAVDKNKHTETRPPWNQVVTSKDDLNGEEHSF